MLGDPRDCSLLLKSLSDDPKTEEATGIEVIQDPYAIQQLYANLVNSARQEILLLLPTSSAFLREQKIGIIKSLQDAAQRGVKIQVLTPTDERISLESESIFQKSSRNIEIRRIRGKSKTETPAEARTKILVIDRKEYLVVELKDDSKETFVDAVRLAIYSTTQSTVKSYITLFESLWEQSLLYDQMEVHDKMQKEFINIAAHELRTPMQPILGMMDILESRFKEDNSYEITKDEFELLFRNAKRMERLATDILEVSRIESNSIKLRKERFDMNEKIRNVVQDIKSLSQTNKKLEITEVTGEPIFVEADKVRVFEVLSNLIRNAIKFTAEGAIIVKAQRNGRNVQVQVKDTGTGIDPEIMPRLFMKFATKSDQGTGLGLFISKNVVEAHGGKIWAENNRDGKGATFSFTLPLS